MIAKKLRKYSATIGKKVLSARFNNRGIRDLSRDEKQIYNSIVRLSEFQTNGKINLQPLMERRKFSFSGQLGRAIKHFISHKVVNDRLSLIRTWGYQRHLHAFFKYCKSQGVHSLSKVDLTFVLQFIRHLDSWKGHPVYQMISMLRNFIKYAYLNGVDHCTAYRGDASSESS